MLNGVARTLSAFGLIQEVETCFESHDNLKYGGVLAAIPALVSQGLLKASEVYTPLAPGYYGFTHILLLLSFMALLRIKSPEQLKNCSPGELGRVMGLDRVPEVKCLREKISQIALQKQAEEFQKLLSFNWIQQEACVFFYVDGHIRVYNGYEANLPKKFVSRQKLCLNGTTEYWVNDEMGIPIMCVIGELNERLKNAIEDRIAPELLLQIAKMETQTLDPEDEQRPLLTLVFDREAYEPAFFMQLWKQRIAVITYRKNVKDKWPEEDFESVEVQVIGKNVILQICEKEVTLNGGVFREVRKQSEDGHQTSIITTHPFLSKAQIAGKMFSRWAQENFFHYMIEDFAFDRMIEYGYQLLDPEKSVVNPIYSKLSYQLKKEKEKKGRMEAKLYSIIEDNLDSSLDAIPGLIAKHSPQLEKIKQMKDQINELISVRNQTPARIKLKNMPEEKRYNMLKSETRLFINLIKMIAYRAETALTNLIQPYFVNTHKEGRMLIKDILSSDADFKVDSLKNTLTVFFHSRSTPRMNKATRLLCEKLNETEVEYPGTNLKLIFKCP